MGLAMLVGCANIPELVSMPYSPSSSSDPDEDVAAGGDDEITDSGPSNEDDDVVDSNSDPCSSAQTFSASLRPDSAQKLNVMLLIDDSGSMSMPQNGLPSTITRVVTNIQSFIQNLAAAVPDSNDLRLGLMFNQNPGSAFGGNNPFSPYLNGSSIFHINEQTNSQASDIAMFKRFAPSDFTQVFPNPFPSDIRYAPNTSLFTPTCGANAYSRPTRHNLSISGGSTTYCINRYSSTLKIEDYFHQGVVNIVAITDDDLNTSFGSDPNNPEGSRFIYNMYRTLVAPVGSNFIYHSIVGTSTADLFVTGDGASIVRPGTAHMMLSNLTGGGVFDVRNPDYNAVLSSLSQQAIFASQTLSLTCAIKAERPAKVYFDGKALDATHFQAQPGTNSLLFNSSAFSAGDESRTINVTVEY